MGNNAPNSSSNNDVNNMSYAENAENFENDTGKKLYQQCSQESKDPDKFESSKRDQSNHPPQAKSPTPQNKAADQQYSRSSSLCSWLQGKKDQNEEMLFKNCKECGGNFQKLKTDSRVKCKE